MDYVGLITLIIGVGALQIVLDKRNDEDYTATWAGYATAPLGVIPVLLVFFVGKYANHMDLRLLAAVSFLVMGVTCFMRADFYLDIDFYHVAMVQLWQGLGVALFFMPVLQILLSDLEQNEIAADSGRQHSCARSAAASLHPSPRCCGRAAR